MDLEGFYEQDERRRQSAEVEFGTEWRDGTGAMSELSWVEDTGELYLMGAPLPEVGIDPFGDAYTAHEETSSLVVEVLGTVATLDEVREVLSGWEDAEMGEDGLAWLRERLSGRGIS
jgi:hypothetical protein